MGIWKIYQDFKIANVDKLFFAFWNLPGTVEICIFEDYCENVGSVFVLISYIKFQRKDHYLRALHIAKGEETIF